MAMRLTATTEPAVTAPPQPAVLSRTARLTPSAAPALWILGAVTILGAALRFTGLGSQSFWFDEYMTFNYVHFGPVAMLHQLLNHEDTPPLYFYVLWTWVRLFGRDEVGLRSLSALFGTATIPLVYAIARTRLSPRAALLAAALMAVSPFAVWYSQEARAYAMLGALSAASLLAFVRVLDGGGRRWVWTWAIASALALATHFFAFFLVIPEAAWLLAVRRERGMVPASAALLAFALPIADLALKDAHVGIGWIHTISLATRLSWIPKQTLAVPGGGSWDITTDVGFRFVLVAALSSAGLLLALKSARSRRRLTPFLVPALAVIGMPLALVVVHPGSDYIVPRYFIPALAPVLIVIAAGFAAGRSRGWGLAAGTVLAGVFLSLTISTAARWQLQRIDWRSAGRIVGTAEVPRAVITADGLGSWPLTRYTPRLTRLYVESYRASHSVQPITIRQLVLVGQNGENPTGASPPPGFRETARAELHGFLVRTFTASRPFRATPATVAAAARPIYSPRPSAGSLTDLAVYLQLPPGQR